MRRVRIALAIGVALLAACSRDDTPVPAAGPSAREVAAGEVNVTITPTRIDTEVAEFTVAFDTHTVDLDLDVAANAALTIDGTDWVDPTWDGARPGGHHRQGTIRFTAGGPASGHAVLTIGGLDEPVTASWTLPAGD